MFFSFTQSQRRRRLLAEPFPETWLGFLRDNMFLYRVLSEREQARLRDALRILIAEKYWEGCRGQEITDEIRVTVAAWASLLVLGFEDFYFENVRTILVYPGGFLVPADAADDSDAPDVHMDLGLAHHRGPVALSWWEARWDGRRPGRRNLVLHEFAHKLAELGDPETGRPPLDDPALAARWEQVAAREYRRLCRADDEDQPTLLDPYGATNRAEFFAVATECFFLRPVALRRRHGELYDVLAAVYRQDPALRRPFDAEDRALARAAREEYDRHLLAECTAAIRHRPDHAEAYRMRAELLCAQGDYDGAIADYRTLIDLSHGEDAEAFCARGIAQRKKGAYAEAIADLSRAIDLWPDYADAYRERGRARIRHGEDAAGRADLDHARKLERAPGR
jgi:Mlc titration factor MtfA (ptsG expression regulator)